MLDEIRFCAPAVAKRDYVPGLTHFKIRDGRITGFNGVMALSSDIAMDLDALPNASKFLAAVRACEGVISLHVTPTGRLTVAAGRFRAHVECLPDEGADFGGPDGDAVELGESFLPGIELLAPVMGIDASRPWSMGIKLSSRSMFATNNVVVAQFWHGAELPFDVVIPAAAIEELIRIGEPPTKVQVTPNAATFWFGPTRWLRTALLDGGSWPIEKIEGLLDTASQPLIPFPEGFFEGVQSLKPFLGDAGTVYVSPQGVRTTRDEGTGASVDLDLSTVPDLQAYNYKQMEVLREVATAIDWTSYPRPCRFTHSDRPLRGVVVGQRL